MINPELIARVRDATDIVAVIGRSVTLKKAGNSWKGLCPFHGEKTPSFNVVPSKQMFHCFGCQEGGDVFAFLMKHDKLNFAEAVKLLAGEAGITVEEQERDPRAEAELKEREELTRLLELAADWFRRNFNEGPEAEAARAYALKRGLSPETLERFQIGYAPGDGGALERAALKKGYTSEQLLKAGLLGKGEDGRTYSRFRRRLIFPIQDARGRVVGFGGRILGEGEPKYLNSPETALFSKGRLLYALPQAKDAMLKKKRALLTEGYMDAIACQQAGIHEAIAVLGTALTEEHAKQLKRYVDQVLLVFDADMAGVRAAVKGASIALKEGLEVGIVSLHGAKDPDEYIKSKSRDEFEKALNEPKEPIRFFSDALLRITRVSKGRNDLSLKEKLDIVGGELFYLLHKYSSGMAQDIRLKEICETFELPLDEAKQEFERFKSRGGYKAVEDQEKKKEKPVVSSTTYRVDNELLSLLVSHPELTKEAIAELPEPDFADEQHQAAAKLLWANPEIPVMSLADDGSEEFRLGESLLSRLAMEDGDRFSSPAKHLQDLLAKRQLIQLEERASRLQRALDGRPGPIEEAALLKQKSEIKVAIQHLKHA
jgi:DNA primase